MESGQEQLFLVADPSAAKARAARSTKPKKQVTPATVLPIAQARVDVSIAHLDRDFDYLVPEELSEAAQIGAKVRVRFNGKLTDAIIVGRQSSSEFSKLLPIERVVGPALTEETLELVLAVTSRYAGMFWDVIRSAVPTKHGRSTAKRDIPEPLTATSGSSLISAWHSYDRGVDFLDQMSRGETVRACWASAPASDWRLEVKELVEQARTHQPEGGVLILLPDAKDVHDLVSLCTDLAPTILTADLGAEERYRAFLSVIEGESSCVIGTRSAVFAPVNNLSLIVMWDDGNDNFAEPHAPYWDAREVAALRSHLQSCSFFVGAHCRSVVTQSWCDSGWAVDLRPSHEAKKLVRGKIRGMHPEDAERDPARARIPRVAWEAVKSGLTSGPVLIQVARKGYIPVLLCTECGERAECSCGGGIAIIRNGVHQQRICERCGITTWRCACGGTAVTAVSIGTERTAEEIGRAFPGFPVVWSQREKIISSVDSTPRIIVSTPGAEPRAEHGFRAVVILDAVSYSISLLAQESLVRRLFGAAVLAAPEAEIVVAAPSDDRAVQALSRWDSVWVAQRELAERAQAHLPPVYRIARLDGSRAGVSAVTHAISATPHISILGPVDNQNGVKVHAFLVVPRSQATQLTQLLAEITRTRSADPKADHVQVRMDPRDF
jgi:primosomal protein N' (replication factor Y) (superfamily II helicase)